MQLTLRARQRLSLRLVIALGWIMCPITGWANPATPTANPWIYFADNGNLSINRIRWDGTDLQVLANTRSALLGMAIDARSKQIYWADNPHTGYSQLHRSNLAGGNHEIVYQAATPNQTEIIGQMAIDEITRQIYWIDEGKDRIVRLNLDGTGLSEVLPSGGSLGTAFELDSSAGRLYFASGEYGNATSKIESIKLDGSNRETVVNAYAYSIFVDSKANRILGGDIERRQVFEIPLQTSERHDLFEVTTPRDVQRYGDHLLFAEVSFTSLAGESGLYSRIVRSDLDGSNRFVVREVNRAVDPADHLALLAFVPEPTSLGHCVCMAMMIVAGRPGRRCS